MFGKNVRAKVVSEQGHDGTYSVRSVFPTIQGEGPFSGRRSVFVRLGGCNLACYWCDTDFEVKGPNVDIPRILRAVAEAAPVEGCLVVITGGEPMRQPIGPLVTQLLMAGHKVQIETSGTVWQPLPNNTNLHIVVSPKTSFVHDNFRHAQNVYWKYVVRGGETSLVDGLPAMSTQIQGKPCNIARPPKGAPVYVSPCDEHKGPHATAANMAEVTAVAMRYGHTVSLQAHKILGVD